MMKIFIQKSSVFILPFLLLYFASIVFGTKEKGDLLRIGNLIDKTSTYRARFSNAFNEDIYYTSFSKNTNQLEFDILTIGDSFSQQKNYGYQNYLAKRGINILHYDNAVNPIETLHSLINGAVFDSLSIKYVLIQSVERYFAQRANKVDTMNVITTTKQRNKTESSTTRQVSLPKLFTPISIKFALFNILYQFDDNAFFSEVYKIKVTEELFSTGNKELLVFCEDLENITYNNYEINVFFLNKELNNLSQKLSEKGVKLIVLPSPDKYSIYYNFIENRSNYPSPKFFSNLSKCKKEYIYIDSKNILRSLIERTKDVYFYDDTHWSPIASEEIAKKIQERI